MQIYCSWNILSYSLQDQTDTITCSTSASSAVEIRHYFMDFHQPIRTNLVIIKIYYLLTVLLACPTVMWWEWSWIKDLKTNIKRTVRQWMKIFLLLDEWGIIVSNFIFTIRETRRTSFDMPQLMRMEQWRAGIYNVYMNESGPML